jgi:hypothetical protein
LSDIQRELQAVLDSIKENYFHNVFEAWKKWWNRCIRSHGDCFEGWQPKLSKLSQHYFLT